MKLPAPRPVNGRHLGWAPNDLATRPYARFWNPVMADISADAHRAVANSPLAEALLPSKDDAIGSIIDAEVQNGFTVTSAGAIHVNLVTEMPGVTPAMIDWWFGWHATAQSATSSGIPSRMCTPSGQRSHPTGPSGAPATSDSHHRSTSTSAAR